LKTNLPYFRSNQYGGTV